MIFNSALNKNPWKRSAPVFFMFNMLTLTCLWIAFDIVGKGKDLINNLLMVIPFCAVFLFFIGYVFGDVIRVKYFIFILGVFGAIPVLILCFMPFVVLLIICGYSLIVKISGGCVYGCALLFWSFVKAKDIKKIEKDVGYLDKQISPGHDCFIINRDKARGIDCFIKKRPIGKISEMIVPKLLPIAVLGYPLQRLVTDVGGNTTTMAFLSIMSVPLSFYVGGRMAAGYMLWVHLINCREKRLGAPILLSK